MESFASSSCQENFIKIFVIIVKIMKIFDHRDLELHGMAK